jgi:hypothetical protein
MNGTIESIDTIDLPLLGKKKVAAAAASVRSARTLS